MRKGGFGTRSRDLIHREGFLEESSSGGFQTQHCDAEGNETVDAWTCEPDCPVAALDEQSGATGASAPVRGTEPSAAVENDAILSPSYAGSLLLITNNTGHPSLTIRTGFKDDGTPHGITLWGRLFDEGTLCRIGMALEERLDVWSRRPPAAPAS